MAIRFGISARERTSASPRAGLGTAQHRRDAMAKGQMKSNKEARKPKKEVKKTIAAAPSTKGKVTKE